MWKRRKRFASNTKVPRKFLLFFLLLLIPLAVFFSIRLGLFTIKQVEIEGKELNCVSNNQLIETSGIYGQNFFFLNSVKMSDNLKRKYLCIKSVDIEKSLPDKVKLQLTARQPLAKLINLKEKEATTSSLIENIATPSAENIGGSYLVDDESIVFAKDTSEINLPKIYIYTKLSLGDNLKDNLIGQALEILNKIKLFNINFSQGFIDGSFFIIGKQEGGPTIVFNLEQDIKIQLGSLQLILTETKINAEELEFIDLRFDKPIIKVAPKKK